MVAVSILGGHDAPPDAAIAFLLPQTQIEMTLWTVVSALAGISEEAIYRGYLQKQFTALTGSLPAGILISAAAFGAVHGYQGWSRAAVIAISAILFGVVAHWRRSVRPGMFAHGLQGCDRTAAAEIAAALSTRQFQRKPIDNNQE
jgi:membrane protease YdiL (CAAX protease family)